MDAVRAANLSDGRAVRLLGHSVGESPHDPIGRNRYVVKTKENSARDFVAI